MCLLASAPVEKGLNFNTGPYCDPLNPLKIIHAIDPEIKVKFAHYRQTDISNIRKAIRLSHELVADPHNRN